MLYEFDEKNYNEAIYNYCLSVAKDNKNWAIDKYIELGGKDWFEASEVSRSMYNLYLNTSVEEMAKVDYKYLRLRSHSISKFGQPIDPIAHSKWIELAGKLEL